MTTQANATSQTVEAGGVILHLPVLRPQVTWLRKTTVCRYAVVPIRELCCGDRVGLISKHQTRTAAETACKKLNLKNGRPVARVAQCLNQPGGFGHGQKETYSPQQLDAMCVTA
jgi:hypothetical protein